jgi:rSAM/selenodomain-associated transferase 2
MTAPVRLSVIIPCVDEAAEIEATLVALRPMRGRGAEVIVVDGGSSDNTVAVAHTHADLVTTAERGRARQMNAGAAKARGDVLFFVHADSHVPERADQLVLDSLSAQHRDWGRFDVAIRGDHALFGAIAATMNARSRWTGIATGDQGIFVTRKAFEQLGGFPDIALMEDVALTTALKRLSAPVCLHERVSTSGRRWLSHGPVRTIFLMWRLRLAYWLGADPNALASYYVSHKQP